MKIKKGRATVTSQIAYLAGFFDGEGCIRIKWSSQRGNCFYIWVAITNSYKPVLDLAVSLFGGKVRRAEKRSNKTIYHYLITSSEAVDMLKTMIGFLREKKSQAQLAISFHEKKSRLTSKQKLWYVKKISDMKRIDYHQNPELLGVK